jgi:hypothetical protein
LAQERGHGESSHVIWRKLAGRKDWELKPFILEGARLLQPPRQTLLSNASLSGHMDRTHGVLSNQPLNHLLFERFSLVRGVGSELNNSQE